MASERCFRVYAVMIDRMTGTIVQIVEPITKNQKQRLTERMMARGKMSSDARLRLCLMEGELTVAQDMMKMLLPSCEGHIIVIYPPYQGPSRRAQSDSNFRQSPQFQEQMAP
jgi:hypothetical protein